MRGDLSGKPDPIEFAGNAFKEIDALDVADCHVLISCSKTKSTHREIARNMYISPLYRRSVIVAERWGMSFSILSAKHGLLRPDERIEPYDLTLKGATKAFKSEWASKVVAQINAQIASKSRLIILAGDDYLVPLLDAAPTLAQKILTPMRGLSLGNRLAFLNHCIRLDARRSAVRHSYEIFERQKKAIGFHRLKDLLDTEIPKQGVYFFFDDDETTVFSQDMPRLVRVGTHGISIGSIATLRNRLRTHLGTRAGAGNHRASVFRLHVGRAIINRDRLHDAFPNWGKGQSAPKDIVQLELDLEKKVSSYIANLRVLFIPVIDVAGTGSMRATIERQFIALFSENNVAIERPSCNWLGQFSDKETIRNTGLWNVRDIGADYDLKFLQLLESFLVRGV